MSRIGKQIIEIPKSVEVKIADDFIVVKGPKGELRQRVVANVNLMFVPNTTEHGGIDIVSVSVKNPSDKKNRSLWGLYQRLIMNMVEGVVEGFEKKLELVGVGYKVSLADKILKINVGFSHPVNFKLPDGIEASVEKNTITIFGIDKQLVGETAARIRKIRKPEPYKGKGIRYSDEVIRRKAGKTAKTSA